MVINEYRVIANEPLEFKGQTYATGEAIVMHCDDCAPLLILGKVRLETTPAPSPPKRPRGRPRKIKPEENSETYQRRDLRAEE